MSRDAKEKGLVFIDRNRDKIVDFCCRLVRTPSENPPGDVSRVASMVSDVLGEYGVESRTYEPEKGKANVVAKVGSGRGGVILNGHMDVVPAGDLSQWEFDPYCGEVRDGWILGRGSADMKGGLAGIVWALIAFVQSDVDSHRPVTFSAVADEEIGGTSGTQWIIERGLVDGGACLIGEPTSASACAIGEKGLCQFKLIARGSSAHGSLPMLGENAIVKLVRSLNVVQKLGEKEVKIPEEIKGIIEGSKVILKDAIKRLRVRQSPLNEVAEALDHVTVNVGTISGGTKINVVPDRCEAEIDVRVPVGISPSEIIEEVKEMITDLGADCKPLAMSEPNYTSPRERVLRIVRRNAKEIVGADPKTYFFTGATDARFFRLRGIPAVHYGPGSIGLAHAFNERVSVDDVISACKVHFASLSDLSTLWPSPDR